MNAPTEPYADAGQAGEARAGGGAEGETTFRLPEHFRHLLASGLEYFQARLELAGLEGKEALVVGLKVGAALFASLALLAFGYVFLLLGVVSLLVWFFGIFWGWVVLGVALLHFIGVALCLLLAKLWWQRPCFPVTLEELRKDQEWLSRSRKTGKQL